MTLFVVGLGRINVKNKDGGSIRLYHVLREFIRKGVAVDVCIPERDASNFRDYGVLARFHLLIDPRWMGDNVVLLYTWRIIRGILFTLTYTQHVDIIYAASDFWHDFLPALTYKLIHPRTKLVTCLFLMAPPPWKRYEDMYTNRVSFPSLWRILFWATQRITIWVGKYFCDAFLVLNDVDASALKQQGIPAHNEFVVSMGVDVPNRFQNKEKKIYDGVFLGRLHPQKGIHDLFMIWQYVVKDSPKARLAIMGGGSAKDIDVLKHEINASGLAKNVLYHGYVDGVKKYRILRQSKVMLVPSHYESWGQVIAEGLVFGLPVLCYDLPTTLQIFKNSVITVMRWDKVKFAHQVISNLITYGDRQRERERMNFVQQFSWKRVSDNDFRILNTIIQRN